MRAKKVIELLEAELVRAHNRIEDLMEDNQRLTAAALATVPAAAAALRPRKEEDPERVPVSRPLGL